MSGGVDTTGLLTSAALAAVAVLVAASAPADAQSEAAMERLLNSVDKPSAWRNVPATRAAPPVQALPMSGFATGQPAPMQQMFAKPQGLSTMPGMSPGGKSGPMNLSKKDLLRMFLEGGGGGSTQGPSNNPNKTYNAQENLQVARDQSAQADSAAERARYGNDRGARMNAAGEAQNHANAARAAADTATSAAAGGPLEANDYAAQARNAANRAQAAADRARSNAESGGGGW